MTNIEKYLKEKIDIKEFAEKLSYEGLQQADYDATSEIIEWLNKPYIELTVDEQITVNKNLDEIVAKAVSVKYNEKEKVLLQQVIKEQQKQIENLKWRLEND